MAKWGEIAAFRVGDLWRFYRSDIQAYIDAQRKQARTGKTEEVAFLFSLDSRQYHQRNHRTIYSTTEQALRDTPVPDQERPFIPVLERAGLTGLFSVKRQIVEDKE